MTDFFTSDTHFCHKNVIKWSERPFDDIEAMEEGIVADWNGAVTPADRVFVTGDFSFGPADTTSRILSRLHGQKFLVRGNHDSRRVLKVTTGWAWVRDYEDMKMGDTRVVLSHFPFLAWHQQHRGAYHLHGHSHGCLVLPESLTTARMMDVGVDATSKWTGSYRPVAWEEIVDRLKDKVSTSTDQHKIKTV